MNRRYQYAGLGEWGGGCTKKYWGGSSGRNNTYPVYPNVKASAVEVEEVAIVGCQTCERQRKRHRRKKSVLVPVMDTRMQDQR